MTINKNVLRAVRFMGTASKQLDKTHPAILPQAGRVAAQTLEIAEKLTAMQNNTQKQYLIDKLASAIEDVIVDFEESAQNLPKEMRRAFIHEALSAVIEAIQPAIKSTPATGGRGGKRAVSETNIDRLQGENPQKEVAPLNYPVDETRTQ